jgi:hypothetical protein
MMQITRISDQMHICHLLTFYGFWSPSKYSIFEASSKLSSILCRWVWNWSSFQQRALAMAYNVEMCCRPKWLIRSPHLKPWCPGQQIMMTIPFSNTHWRSKIQTIHEGKNDGLCEPTTRPTECAPSIGMENPIS